MTAAPQLPGDPGDDRIEPRATPSTPKPYPPGSLLSNGSTRRGGVRPRGVTGSAARKGMTTGGIIAAVIIGIAGLAVLAYVIFFVVAFASWGNNK